MKKLSKANRAKVIEEGLKALTSGDLVVVTKQINGGTYILLNGTFQTTEKIAPFSMQGHVGEGQDFNQYFAVMLVELLSQVKEALEQVKSGVKLTQMELEG